MSPAGRAPDRAAWISCRVTSSQWQTTSPPPHDNFAVSPEAGDPYDLEAFRWDAAVGGYVKKSDAAVAVG